MTTTKLQPHKKVNLRAPRLEDAPKTASPAVSPARDKTSIASGGHGAARATATADVFEASPGAGAVPPALFSSAELSSWSQQISDLRAPGNEPAFESARQVFSEIRLRRAAQHPGAVADALLTLVGTRGEVRPRMTDVFQNIGEGQPFAISLRTNAPVAYRDQVAKHDTPETRRLLHTMLGGLMEMPTTVAASGATDYFLGTGSFNQTKKAGVGLLSSSNAWAKEAQWKNADTQRVVQALFVDQEYDSSHLGNLLTQPDEEFQGYPDARLWEAARNSTSASPFAMTHSVRNKELIGAMMRELET
ncbi:MAG: hypothetical protein HY901_36860, partial [Deltaproteobacteria bacterium]|nr:hypothetical protein [Deltaproteobacteria bacterium]